MKKRGYPEYGELVICKITKIHPNSAFAELTEYNRTGMIHVSEVARRWVRDIREFLKENQYVVCRVMGVEGEHIYLSVKRVAKEQASSKLSEFKREKKAEKMLELAGKDLSKSLEESYEEIGYKLQDYFGSLTKTFDVALNNPELLLSKGVPKNWADALVKTAKKSYVEKEYEVKARLKLICYEPDGVRVIRNALSKARENDLEVRYISTPTYMLIGKGKNHRELEARVEKIAEDVVKGVEQNNGEGSFEMLE